MFEIRSHTYYNYGDFESFTCTSVFPINNSTLSDNDDATEDSICNTEPGLKLLVKGPQLTTPCKPTEGKETKR